MKKRVEPFQRAILLTLILILFFAGSSLAAQSSFRTEFMQAREANRFEALISIVKNNKDNIPAEVKSLLKDALSGDKTFYERMRIIDTASALASMHKYWNAGEKPLIEVEAVQKQLITAENERLAGIEKLARYERYPGNVLMNDKEANLSAKGLSPVVFSHWSHRLFYECRACHNGLFKPERGTNGISHAALREGRLCGACHNGSIAFGSNDTCEKCHSASKSSKTGPVDPSADTDLLTVKHTGDGLGAVWEPEKLINRALPLDRLGLVDWMELRKSGAYAPLKSHNRAEAANQGRDNVIIFTPRMPGINRVSFSHASHTKEIDCATCHPSVFKDALGANKISMAEMPDGKACGYCHGKVAFKFADCKRCHSLSPLKGAEPQGPNILMR
ncbi:MAG: hypothetical protein HZB82_05885 [Deltaproteobacteria bacterium]|nr:hypothetical protein [Deltaproteobacteria bacterium]